MADVTALERVGDEAERLALAAQHVDLVGARAGRDLRQRRASATASASRSRSTSSTTRRGVSRLSRQTSGVASSPRRDGGRGGRSMRGSVDTSLAGDGADLGRVPAKAREQVAGGSRTRR